MTSASLGTAIAGVVLGGSALGWQIYIWPWSGPRVTVSAFRSHLYRRLDSGELEPILADPQVTTVTVTNRGRLPAHAIGYGFRLTGPRGTSYDVDIHESDPETIRPTVPPHDSNVFHVGDPLLLSDMAAKGLDRGKAFVRLATEDVVRDSKDIHFFDDEPGSPKV